MKSHDAGFVSGLLIAGCAGVLQLRGKPFAEGTWIKLGYAYEQTTKHRKPPAGFDDLP